MAEISKIFSANLKRLRGNRSQAEFSTFLGIKSQATYHNYEAGRVPKTKVLAEIAEKLNCTPGDLITDRDEVKRLPAGWRFVPVISWARAGAQDFNYSDLEGQIDDTLISDVKDVNAYAIIVEGDSMEPRVTAGDRVVTMPNSEARNGDLVVARLEESGGVMVKYFKRTGPEGETVTLTSQNELYKAVSFPYGAFRFIHPVYEVRSKRR